MSQNQGKKSSEVSFSRTDKVKVTAIMTLYAFLLGALSGSIVWAFLKVLEIGMDFFWTTLPEITGHISFYILIVCSFGGILIGLFQKKFGIYPDTMEEVFAKLKKNGTYDYHALPVILAAVLMPLFFGGSLGPEAGLTGIITCLCCAVGDHLKYSTEQIRDLAGSGITATLGIIFHAPLFGLVNDFEHPRKEERFYFAPKEFRAAKIVVYCAGIAGGLLSNHLLSSFFGGGMGLPRFTWNGWAKLSDWKWFPVLAACGIGLGLLYQLFGNLTRRLAKLMQDRRILSCLTAGLGLALLGIWNSRNLFSGESDLLNLTETWQTVPIALLLATAVTKLFCTNLCLSMGWKGGSIFPIIYCGTSLGYGLAALTGVLPIFSVAVCAASCYGYIIRKPLTVTTVLFLCFPIRLVLPLIAAAYLASLIPAPASEPESRADENRA
ncbi:MAG: chloride channel protein [Bilifractor sp.]|jgi:H+/Cl- antiporter ClcA